MSIVMPLAGTLCRWVVWLLQFEIPWPDWMRSQRDCRRKPGMVSVLHRAAMQQQANPDDNGTHT